MNDIDDIDPQTATIEDAVDELHGEQGVNGDVLHRDSPPQKLERAARRVVRLATPFDPVKLGILEASLMQDSYRNFGHRMLRSLVKGIMGQVAEYQKNARAVARKANKKK